MKRLLAIALLAVSCGNTAQPSAPSASPTAAQDAVASPVSSSSSASASATVAATPTLDPESVRKIAAAAYLAAAEAANKADAALAVKYKTFANLSKARSYYRAYAAIEGTFVKALRKIIVPADTKTDLHSLIAKAAASQALAVEGSGVKSWTEQESVDAALVRAARASSAAANLVRSDLGLPPVHQ